MKALLAEEKEIMMMNTMNINDLQLEWWKETTTKIMERRRLHAHCKYQIWQMIFLIKRQYLKDEKITQISYMEVNAKTV
jgi:hypothetical protein